MLRGPAEMVGTALTGYGWQTYYVTADGDLIVHVGDTATADDAPAQLLGHYDTVELARAVARHRLRRDVRTASEDVRGAFTDIATLIAHQHHALALCVAPVSEAPVTPGVARRSLPSVIRS